MINELKTYLFGSSSRKIKLIYNIALYLHKKNYRIASKLVFRKIQVDYGVYISPKAKIGNNIRFPHPNGIVIGEKVVIEDNVTIYQQVTLGGARIGDWEAGRYPSVGAGTVIFAGAKIIGPVVIGKNCVIGANAVVLRDVPDNHTAVGVPAVNRPRKDASLPDNI